MIHRRIFLAIGLTLFLLLSLHAEEGLWLPTQLETVLRQRIRQAGCRLTAEDIYNVNQASLKDAVLSIGGFCTGSFISRDGLVLTNHHCVSDLLTDHSTDKHNYFRDGFWAHSYRQELPNEYLWARRLIRIDDVTSAFASVQQYSEGLGKRLAFSLLADSLIQARIPQWEAKLHLKGLKGQVRPFFNGRQYLLMIYQEFQDVRLVGAPPLYVGKFGGNKDNWQWPRHSGDFAFLRIYVDTSGYPAEYAPTNVPYRPPYFFRISTAGLSEKDYTMVMGFPGKTNRYGPPHEIAMIQYAINPAYISILKGAIHAMEISIEATDRNALALADRYASAANFYKYTVGQQEGLFRYRVLDTKMKEAAQLYQWVKKHRPSQQWVFDSLGKAVYYAAPVAMEYHFLSWFFSQPLMRPLIREIIRPMAQGEKIEHFPWKQIFRELQTEYDDLKYPLLETEILGNGLAQLWIRHQRRMDLDDKMRTLARQYGIPYPAQRAQITYEKRFQRIFYQHFATAFQEQMPYSFIHEVKAMMQRSMLFSLSTTALYRKWVRDPYAALQEDAFLSFIHDLYVFYIETIRPQYARGQQLLNSQIHHYRDLYFSWRKIDSLYPDANSTLRFTYGHVLGYLPADAVEYRWYTTQHGIIEKYQPHDPNYHVSAAFIDLLRSANFGRYAAAPDTLPVCFITTNDISGGNSGSPVLNDRGYLVGVAFDSNWEGIISDLLYIPETSRTIAVDIRYVLWYVQKVAHNMHILRGIQITSKG